MSGRNKTGSEVHLLQSHWLQWSPFRLMLSHHSTRGSHWWAASPGAALGRAKRAVQVQVEQLREGVLANRGWIRLAASCCADVRVPAALLAERKRSRAVANAFQRNTDAFSSALLPSHPRRVCLQDWGLSMHSFGTAFLTAFFFQILPKQVMNFLTNHELRWVHTAQPLHWKSPSYKDRLTTVSQLELFPPGWEEP